MITVNNKITEREKKKKKPSRHATKAPTSVYLFRVQKKTRARRQYICLYVLPLSTKESAASMGNGARSGPQTAAAIFGWYPQKDTKVVGQIGS